MRKEEVNKRLCVCPIITSKGMQTMEDEGCMRCCGRKNSALNLYSGIRKKSLYIQKLVLFFVKAQIKSYNRKYSQWRYFVLFFMYVLPSVDALASCLSLYSMLSFCGPMHHPYLISFSVLMLEYFCIIFICHKYNKYLVS